MEWIDLWTTEQLPTYGERYPRQLRERTFAPVIAEVIPFSPLELEDRDAFILTPEQRAEMNLKPEEERDDHKRYLTNVWVRAQRAQNCIIIRENERIKAEYGDSLKYAREDAAINAKIFVDVMRHMNQVSRDRVRQYSENRNKEDPNDIDDHSVAVHEHIDVPAVDEVSILSVATAVLLEERGSAEFEQAKVSNNWVWLFEAAFNTHAVTSQGDEYSRTEELVVLKARVEALSMQRQDYFGWITRVKREIQMEPRGRRCRK